MYFYFYIYRCKAKTKDFDCFKGYIQADSPLVLNSFSTNEEQHSQIEGQIPLQELAELLGVKSGASASEDRSCWSETDSGQQNPSVVYLINKSVSQCFPKPSADLNQNLQQHLLNVQASVCKELVRLGPLLKSMGLMGCLIGSYHQQTFHHLSVLLQNCSSQNILLLMKWVLHTYLRYLSVSSPAFSPALCFSACLIVIEHFYECNPLRSIGASDKASLCFKH